MARVQVILGVSLSAAKKIQHSLSLSSKAGCIDFKLIKDLILPGRILECTVVVSKTRQILDLRFVVQGL